MKTIAEAIRLAAADSQLPSRLRRALQNPTPNGLRELADHGIAAGRADFAIAAMTGLARLHEQQGDAAAAAEAWRECIARDPQGAAADWFLSLARLERRCGRFAEAEAALRACLDRHADLPAALASLADLLAASGRTEEAAAIWRDLFARPSISPEPWWFTGCAAVARAQGRPEAEQQMLDQLIARFPHSIVALETAARRAAAGEDWQGALAAWRQLLDTHADKANPAWLNGQATALTRLWRLEDAIAVDAHLTQRFPDYAPGLVDAAARAMEFGRNEAAYARLREAVARQPNLAEAWERLARCAMGLKRFDEVDRALGELRARCGDSPLGARTALLRARTLRLPFGSQREHLQAALGAFPADRELLALQAQFSLAVGDLAAAQAAVKALREGGDDHLSLIARWRLELEMRGETVLREGVERDCAGRAWTLAAAEAAALFLLELWSAWATQRGLEIVTEIDRRHPRRPHIVALRARALIALDRDEEALDIVDALPLLCVTPAVRELRAWAAARRGRHDEAKQIWRETLCGRYCAEVDAPLRNFKRVRRPRSPARESRVTAFMAVRDEMPQLADFLAHHRRLGVHRFVVVDNMSDDGSFEFLAAQKDVALYRTGEDFGQSATGMRWINELMRRYNARWRLFLDADERFLFAGCESASIDDLLDALEAEGAEAMAAIVLDMFPERLFDAGGAAAPLSAHVWFDADYRWRGEIRAPYARPMGGARARLFGSQEYLQKVPLTRAGCATYIGNHEVTHARLATSNAALLHFKLYSLASAAAASEARQGGARADGNFEVMRRYLRYRALRETFGAAALVDPNASQRLTDSSLLSELGLLRALSNPADRKPILTP